MIGGLYLSKQVTIIDIESIYIQHCGAEAIYIPDEKSSRTIVLFARTVFDTILGNLGSGLALINMFAIHKEGASIQRMLKVEAEHDRQQWMM
jgi:hypothetical protein